jgi:hypothetical protein
MVTEDTWHHGERRSSHLDCIFTRCELMVENLRCSAPIGKGDLVCISWDFRVEDDYLESKEAPKYNFWKGKYDLVAEELRKYNWNDIFQPLSACQSWQSIKQILHDLILKYVPKMRAGRLAKKVPKSAWISKESICKLKQKGDAWRKYKRDPTQENYTAYKKIRNQVVTLIRHDKGIFHHSLIESFKQKPKRFYSYIRKLRLVNERVPGLKTVNDTITTSESESAEVLVNFYSSVFVRETDEDFYLSQTDSSPDTDNTIEFKAAAVLQRLKKLRTDKSPGPDGLHPNLLRECAAELAGPLTLIFQKS